MSPFDPNLDNDAAHAIDQDDLIAFHLHELTPHEERALRRILYTNTALRSESLAIASALRAFPKHEPVPARLDNAAAHARIWQTLQPNLTPYIPATATPFAFLKSPFTRWAFPTLAGAALATLALILTLHHNPHTPPATIATTASPSFATAASTALPPRNAAPANGILPAATHSISTKRESHAPLTNQLPSQLASASPISLAASEPIPSQPIHRALVPPGAAVSTNNSITAQTAPAPSQIASASQPVASAHPAARRHYQRTTDITLAVLGNFTPDRSFTSTATTGSSTVTAYYTQETTPSIGALASFHQQLRPWLGYRVAASYAEPTFEYVYTEAQSDSHQGNIVYQHAYELSATYVVRGPHHRRISTAAEGGTGLLALIPTNVDQAALPIGNTFHAEGVFGVSAEYLLTRHVAIHAGYRGLVYKAPEAYSTFGAVVPPAPNNLTLSSQAVLGLTYRFHRTNAE